MAYVIKSLDEGMSSFFVDVIRDVLAVFSFSGDQRMVRQGPL